MAEHHRFSSSSIKRLAQCEQDLDRVVTLALKYSKYDFGITESLRSQLKQAENVANGKSQTMKSRHLANSNGLSEAVDIVIYKDGKPTYEPKLYRKVAAAFFKAAFELGVGIEWGGHYESFFDGVHFNLTERK